MLFFKKGAVDPPTYQYKIGQTGIISALKPRVPHTQMITNVLFSYTIVLSLKIQQKVKFARTYTTGFSTNFHLKPEIRTNNCIGDSSYWSNNEQGRI